MLFRATHAGWVMVESSDKMWSTGEENGKLLQNSCLENPTKSMKRQKYMTLDTYPRLVWSNMSSMLLRKSGKITLERMKRLDQSENHAHLWMHLVLKVKFDAVKNNTLHAAN